MCKLVYSKRFSLLPSVSTMTLLASDDRARGENATTGVVAPETEARTKPNQFRNKKNKTILVDATNRDLQRTNSKVSTSLRQQRHSKTTKLEIETRPMEKSWSEQPGRQDNMSTIPREISLPSSAPIRRHSKSMRTTRTAISTVQLEIGSLPMECSWHSSARQMQQERVSNRRSIPIEISFDDSSSLSVVSDLDSEDGPQIRRVTKHFEGDERQRDFHNKCICLELLESERFDDNCIGMEHLVSITNRELVNSSKLVLSDPHNTEYGTSKRKDGSLLISTIAYSLVCNSSSHETYGEFARRLRAVFPSFLFESQQETSHRRSRSKTQRSNRRGDSWDTDSTESLSLSSSSPSCPSSANGSSRMVSSTQHGEITKTELKLPALRILVSSLELVSRTRALSPRLASSSSASGASSISMDLLNGFWKLILTYMTECLQGLVTLPRGGLEDEAASSRVEAALVVKGFRLLNKLQPEMMNPYLRHSLLPFVSNARKFGAEQQQQQCKRRNHRRQSSADKMLVRECERLLKSFS